MELLYKYIDSSKEEIIDNTCKLLKIPSVLSTSSNKSRPFGDDVNIALEYMLELGEHLGFRTKNVDGYSGYIEFGDGDEMLGIISHLDVVPADDNWTHPPFSGTIANGKIYGRGTIDDKGPTIASLFAMKAVMENCNVNKRVRLILGLSEETTWDCINYYKSHEESPTISFSPDGDFPCIYAEKGSLSLYLEQEYTSNESITINKIICNNIINAVPNKCSVELTSDDINNLIGILNSIIKENNFNIVINKTSDTTIIITSIGIAAHAAHPEKGKNAIAPLLLLLKNIMNLPILNFYNDYIATEYNGEKLNLNFIDESGPFTLNVGTLKLKNNKISIGINMRTPINLSIDHAITTFSEILDNRFNSVKLIILDKKNALYVPKDSSLVKTLCAVYNELSGLNQEPIAIGGTTFAKAFENCIAFGPTLPNEEFMGHKIDEFITIDNLIMCSKVYAKSIYELTK